MKGVFLGVACLAVTAGLASASSTQLKPTLSFTVAAGVSDYDNYVGPLGGGICLGNARVTDPKEDAGVAWSPDGQRVAFYRAITTLQAGVFVAHVPARHDVEKCLEPWRTEPFAILPRGQVGNRSRLVARLGVRERLRLHHVSS